MVHVDDSIWKVPTIKTSHTKTIRHETLATKRRERKEKKTTTNPYTIHSRTQTDTYPYANTQIYNIIIIYNIRFVLYGRTANKREERQKKSMERNKENKKKRPKHKQTMRIKGPLFPIE